VPALGEAQYERLGELAHEHALTGMLIAWALALAAVGVVEVVEGRPRELRWNAN